MVNINSFYKVDGWMINEFKGYELTCFAIIFSYSCGELGKFVGGFSSLAEMMKCSETTASRALSALIEKELVKKEEIITNTGRRSFYIVNDEKVNSIRKEQLKKFEKEVLSKGKDGYFQNESMGTFKMKVNNKYSNNENIESKSVSNDTPKVEDELFETFWDKYNYKKGKEKAKQSWKRLKKEEKELAIKAIEEYKEDCRRNKRPMKHPTTYLNQKTWNDDFTSDGMIQNLCYEPNPNDEDKVRRFKEWMRENHPEIEFTEKPLTCEGYIRLQKQYGKDEVLNQLDYIDANIGKFRQSDIEASIRLYFEREQ